MSSNSLSISQQYVQAAVEAVSKITGKNGLDYLLNNAGTSGSCVPIHEE